MKIHFYLRFYTQFGQSLSITGNISELGNGSLSDTIPMLYLNNEFWHATIEINNKKENNINYSYILTDADGSQITEDERDRIIEIPKTTFQEVQVIDCWNIAGAYENAFLTSPFQEILLPHDAKLKTKIPKTFTHIFQVKAPLLKKNEVVCLAGSGIALGDWKKEEALFLSKEGNWWTAKVNIPHESFPLQYKYVIYNTKDKDSVFVEANENRHLHGNPSDHSLTVVHDGFVRCPNNTWKGAGASIPVFSLKSKTSFGVGEFTDLRLLVDWAKEVGLKLIQILPVNDTTATYTSADSYPYAAISAFALHPIYINLDKVAGKKNAGIVKPLKKKQAQLNDEPELNYEEVLKFKLSVLKELFTAQKEDYLNDTEFYDFFQTNRHWLVPYAAFCSLRDKNGTSDSSLWKTHKAYIKETIEKYVSPKAKHYDDIFLQYFIQYHLHLQLKEATEYAHKKGIILKGDIPIGVYRYSCDAWTNPELFNMDMQAGAPPDDFAVKGQNWGFPTYNWQKMQENGFAWWRRRFEQMSNYFDAFRIDHILGFFRIWSVPIHAVEGIMGYFVPAIPVHIKEFTERQILFDYDRYIKPFIDDEVIQKFFGDLAETAKQQYLKEGPNRTYLLHEDFDTQRKVEIHFAGQPQIDENNKIKTGLFDCISNVILFDAGTPPKEQFHFRIDMDKTPSFYKLDWNTKNQLKDLYIDYFYRRQDDFWKKEAMKKLPALKASTNMLICGEDLGMVPGCVPQVMNQLGILSLEIQRMPKNPSREFFHPNDAPYLSVVMPSTHDMSTIRGWWQEDRAKTQRFFNNELGQWGDVPLESEPWINKAIILQHLYSPAMWAIFQLQDLFGMSEKLIKEDPSEERINIPADPKHFWGYRMQFPLEQLLKEKEFNTALKSYIHASGR